MCFQDVFNNIPLRGILNMLVGWYSPLPALSRQRNALKLADGHSLLLFWLLFLPKAEVVRTKWCVRSCNRVTCLILFWIMFVSQASGLLSRHLTLQPSREAAAMGNGRRPTGHGQFLGEAELPIHGEVKGGGEGAGAEGGGLVGRGGCRGGWVSRGGCGRGKTGEQISWWEGVSNGLPGGA